MSISEAINDLAQHHGLNPVTDPIYLHVQLRGSHSRRDQTIYRLVKCYPDGITIRRLLDPNLNPNSEATAAWVNQSQIAYLAVILKPIKTTKK